MIKLNNVTVSYASHGQEKFAPALQNVEVEFKKGSITAVLGASGAGKTTLLRSINLLTRPDKGSIASPVIGNPLSTKRALREHRRNTAMIFQKHQLLGRYTALKNVLLGRTGHQTLLQSLLPASKLDLSSALGCLERVGLLNKALEQVQNLSVGQQQRVGIARALCQEAPLLLADEPIASLDPDNARRVLDLLRAISLEDKLSTVVSLHQVDYALEFSDHILGLKQGTVVIDAKTSEVSKEALLSLYQSKPTIDQSLEH